MRPTFAASLAGSQGALIAVNFFQVVLQKLDLLYESGGMCQFIVEQPRNQV
ncbi:hypothetical protein [Leptolyngbya sp. FACHB-711]|uniref:hypothetical protein n=1 Tax=unclassified Leptolyngbya TaxID=2650499 RepID=UPI0016822506|nr:hypothetical protein [Leptolyngbya sp. FACHB-711]MBD1849781.1 hypothetical protein [Cyanobacteria bacterium FACHB-502]MBD2027091.1 hypothetical protein [Leptolyngbya sp. FACHB-711]